MKKKELEQRIASLEAENKLLREFNDKYQEALSSWLRPYIHPLFPETPTVPNTGNIIYWKPCTWCGKNNCTDNHIICGGG